MGGVESKELNSLHPSSDGAFITPTESEVASSEHPLHPNLVVCQSRALQILFTKMRDVKTSNTDFVKYSKRAMSILAEEALAELPSKPVQIRTPCGPCAGIETIDPSQVCAVSIVRSGDALLEVVRDLVPAISVGKILIQRDENLPDKPANLYYCKLPKRKRHILLCDPMLATGGSATVALDVLINKYHVPAANIVFANMICCPEGLQALARSFPEIKIVTAQVDPGLNAEKYIVPGLGDYGDRYFGTND